MDTNGVREVAVFDGITVGELGLKSSRALMCDKEVMRPNRKLIDGAGNTLPGRDYVFIAGDFNAPLLADGRLVRNSC